MSAIQAEEEGCVAVPEPTLCDFFLSLNIDEESAKNYSKAFEANHVTPSIYQDLSEDDLEKMGVASLGHRKLLLRAMRSGKSTSSAPDYVEMKQRKHEAKLNRRTAKNQYSLQAKKQKNEYKLGKKRSNLERKARKYSPDSPSQGNRHHHHRHHNNYSDEDKERALTTAPSPGPLRWSKQKQEHKLAYKAEKKNAKLKRREADYARSLQKQQHKAYYKQQKYASREQKYAARDQKYASRDQKYAFD